MDWPTRKLAGIMPRMSDGENPWPGRCTPCAPAASVTSSRSFTITRVREPDTTSTARRVSWASSRIGKSRSRTWKKSAPARPAAAAWAITARACASADAPGARRRRSVTTQTSPRVRERGTSARRVGRGRLGRFAAHEQADEIEQSGHKRDHADPRKRSPDPRTQEDGGEAVPADHEEIALPERRPRRNDKHEADFEEVRDDEQPTDERGVQLSVSTRESRSMRDCISRYSPTSAISSMYTASARAYSFDCSSVTASSYSSCWPSSADRAGASAARSIQSIAAWRSCRSRYKRQRSAAASKRCRGERAACSRAPTASSIRPASTKLRPS